jgi:hypothetical protein
MSCFLNVPCRAGTVFGGRVSPDIVIADNGNALHFQKPSVVFDSAGAQKDTQIRKRSADRRKRRKRTSRQVFQMELDDRAEGSYGRLLEWHLLRGTRPGGRLDHPGRKWSVKAFSEAVGVGDRTVRYWLKDEHLPPEIETIERVMFGNDACYAEWRLGLRRAHARSWAAKGTGETARAALQEAPQSLASPRPRRLKHFDPRTNSFHGP